MRDYSWSKIVTEYIEKNKFTEGKKIRILIGSVLLVIFFSFLAAALLPNYASDFLIRNVLVDIVTVIIVTAGLYNKDLGFGGFLGMLGIVILIFIVMFGVAAVTR